MKATIGFSLGPVLAAALFASGLVPAFAAEDAVPQAFRDAGCWSCHGYYGQGGREGPRIAHGALDYAAFSTFVRTTSGDMPPFSARVVPDAQLMEIYAYLQSVPEPPDAGTIPLLQGVFAD